MSQDHSQALAVLVWWWNHTWTHLAHTLATELPNWLNERGKLSHTLSSDSSQRAVEEAWLISGSGTSGLKTPPAADSSTLSSCSHWLYICGNVRVHQGTHTCLSWITGYVAHRCISKEYTWYKLLIQHVWGILLSSMGKHAGMCANNIMTNLLRSSGCSLITKPFPTWIAEIGPRNKAIVDVHVPEWIFWW